MSLKLHTLPILEQWDCHACTACCRETTIPLSRDDLARLAAQKWDQHPDFRGKAITRRASPLGGERVLAHRGDGSCVFLTAAGRCRIHEQFGVEAKPRVCQLFPLQAIASDCGATVTVRRSCPSAAADRGHPLEQHLPVLKRLLRDQFGEIAAPAAAPPIVRGVRRSWDDFHLVADALMRLTGDARLPLVRRIMHGLQFCELLDELKWNRVGASALPELIPILEQSAPNEVGAYFQDRQPPTRSTAKLFRRLGAHFIRCVPGGSPMRTWRDHWRAARLSGRLARAQDEHPQLHPQFPAIAAEQLERPLGPLPDDVLRPLDRFFQAHAASQQYALTDPRLPLTTSYRRLAFAFPTALWMLRWLAAERTPTHDDMVSIVVALERGYVLPALARAATLLADTHQLQRLIAWYAR
jgi:lysine-N-methylase